ncbi:universal stress protein [Neptuniibacter sp. UBA6509]|uniref:universal stress protein n=1 Tax=Neptuniibacter sp. UBA6509 TaxID=1946976 RepID=UPI0025D14CD7|nr:universal stress protein [Neptuniibacter sp. UBA6509]|tara:strand:+ start:4566 stop:5015 length:450 start_codon:yes stop_codon:yes gene_type:complete
MSTYNKILLALDLSSESDQLREKTCEIAKSNKAELHLLHVIEPLSFAYGGDVPMDLTSIQEQLNDHAKDKLAKFCNQLDYPVASQQVSIGQTETEIHRIADNENVDLIIVGSHGRHGIALLLGSTANGVLHGANCDVLAVRIQEEQNNG